MKNKIAALFTDPATWVLGASISALIPLLIGFFFSLNHETKVQAEQSRFKMHGYVKLPQGSNFIPEVWVTCDTTTGTLIYVNGQGGIWGDPDKCPKITSR